MSATKSPEGEHLSEAPALPGEVWRGRDADGDPVAIASTRRGWVCWTWDADNGWMTVDSAYVLCIAFLAERARAERAEGMLRRAVKYAREDRMVTPGVTRLARVLEEAAVALGVDP